MAVEVNKQLKAVLFYPSLSKTILEEEVLSFPFPTSLVPVPSCEPIVRGERLGSLSWALHWRRRGKFAYCFQLEGGGVGRDLPLLFCRGAKSNDSYVGFF